MTKEDIIRELPEDFVRKMRNWVRSMQGGSYAKSGAYDGMSASSGYAEASIPVLGGEASDIHMALGKVRERERVAVELFWQYEGNSLRWLGRRLMVKSDTAAARVHNGHLLLQDELVNLHRSMDRMAEQAAEAMQSRTPGASIARSYLRVTRLQAVQAVQKVIDTTKIGQ